MGPADLGKAIALNSAPFNSARLVGTAVAGLAIGVVGIAGCFYLNGLSFVAAIAGLAAIRAGRVALTCGRPPSSVSADLREGLAYVARTRLVWTTVLLVAVVGTFAMNLNVLVPVMARDVLGVGAGGFALLSSAAGVGSLAAALVLAAARRTPSMRALVLAAVAFGGLELILAPVRQFALAAIVLAAIGFAMIYFTTLANTLLQLGTPDALRGRVMSVYATVFAGTTPLGSLFAGSLAEAGGVGLPLALGGLISLGAGLLGQVLSSSRRT